jgi:hypothetical protein
MGIQVLLEGCEQIIRQVAGAQRELESGKQRFERRSLA